MIVSSGYRKYGFDASGGKVLRKKDMSFWMNSSQRTDPDGVCFELGKDVEEVEPDFFQLVPTIDELWILNPKCGLLLSEADSELFKKNRVLFRGEFGSAAEKLAKKLGLCFLHTDAELARQGDYYDRGVDVITLRFYSDGSAYINQDCRCQGISAGNTGGGELDFDLPDDFYKTMTAEEIAGMCWGSCYDRILEKGVLAQLLKEAKANNGFYKDFSKKE